jgi:hypothetical protein
MEIKIILLYGDRFIKIISQQITRENFITIKLTDEIKNSDLLNDVEKDEYLIFMQSYALQRINNNGFNPLIKVTEFFLNPYNNRCIVHYENFCSKVNNNEDIIINFVNYNNQHWKRVSSIEYHFIEQEHRLQELEEERQYEERQRQQNIIEELLLILPEQENEVDSESEECEEDEHIFIRKVCYQSKVQSECPICYDNTSCYRFYSCNHVQCFDCYLQMAKNICVYRCNT